MGIGNLGWTELLLLGFIILLLFGARRLPEIGQSLGRGIREFKKSVTASDDEPQVSSDDRPVPEVEAQRKHEEAR